MRLSAADIAKYPEFARYVRLKIPQLVHAKAVVYNLKTKGNLSDAQVRHALHWGTDPLIVITDLSKRPVRSAKRLWLHAKFKPRPDRDR